MCRTFLDNPRLWVLTVVKTVPPKTFYSCKHRLRLFLPCRWRELLQLVSLRRYSVNTIHYAYKKAKVGLSRK